MRKVSKIAAVAAVSVIAGAIGWHALADEPQHGPGFGPPFMHGMGPGMGMGHGPMRGEFADPAKRLASLKTELAITPAQEAAWNAYAKTVEDTAASMKAEHQGFDPGMIHAMTDQERQAFFDQRREQAQKAHGTVKAAAETLLTSLDDAQKAKAKETLPGLVQRGPGMMRHAFSGGPPMMHHEETR